MRFNLTVTGWDELQQALAALTANAGERFLAPGLNAAAKVLAVRSRQTKLFNDGPNRRGASSRRLRSTIRNRVFRGGRLKGRGAGVFVGGRGFEHAIPLIFGQDGTPKADPYRGGPQSIFGNIPERRFVLAAFTGSEGEQEQAFSTNLRRRFPTLLRRLARRRGVGRTQTIGGFRGRQLALRRFRGRVR